MNSSRSLSNSQLSASAGNSVSGSRKLDVASVS